MKLVTWNCNMAFRKKSDILIEQYNPDIILIQECEHNDKLKKLQEEYNILWLGDNKNKGIATLIKKQYDFEAMYVDTGTVRYVLGVKVGKLKVINLWAMNDENDLREKYAHFVPLKLYREMESIMVNKDISANLVRKLLLTSLILQSIKARKHWINGLNTLSAWLMVTLLGKVLRL